MRAFFQHFSHIGKALREFSGNSQFYQLSCFLLAISRLLQVVSFFLPLKILIMLSSKQPPSYLEYLPIEITYDTALTLLILMVPTAYCGYMIAGVFHRFFIDRDLAKWKESGYKTTLINVKSKAKLVKLHAHLSKALSEIILVVMSLLLVLVIDFPMFVVVCIMLFLNLKVFVAKVFYKSDQGRVGVFRLHRRQYIEYFTSMNFVIVFMLLAAQVSYSYIGIFEALFVILLSRMMFQSMQRFSVENLYIVHHLGFEQKL
ncbi:hypothetical protein [Halomonas icarae]|uniref:Uncharacterized protein n=1 Tax=Halomonas icarae TaxID=2691040 RepID=A0A7X5ALE7_9GAMM|nr:hypothetical protein [Halomonas icarae]MDR5902782.1 hypothetical protein [Halomonas icarae]NAW13337.1 hypothetical protein [Halomonas icarae]